MVCDTIEGVMSMSKVWFITGTRSGAGEEIANVSLQEGHRVAGVIVFKGAAFFRRRSSQVVQSKKVTGKYRRKKCRNVH